MRREDTIVAVATGVGGAIAVVRVSGDRAIEICDLVFVARSGQRLSTQKGFTLHYGEIVVESGEVLDDVLVSLFRGTKSYTGEDMVEISCHGSAYIKQELIKLLITKGARHADAGEFTIRAYLAGKLDLSQAEAVADIIASNDQASHRMATNQLRGGYSDEFGEMRAKLLELVSLLELELDFSEEDVEFADRKELQRLVTELIQKTESLIDTFSLGNAIKEGIRVAIIGHPNVGKSTLLNALVGEDRAMVSEIAGTTRDVIEESLNIGGASFRFLDTAGIRETDDVLEKMGIERSLSSIEKAHVILYIIDAEELSVSGDDVLNRIEELELDSPDKDLLLVINKCDKLSTSEELERILSTIPLEYSRVAISARNSAEVCGVTSFLSDYVARNAALIFAGDAVVSNSRHYEALLHTHAALTRSLDALSRGLPTDLLSQDLREGLHFIGEILGEITTDEILANIFSKFCIGK